MKNICAICLILLFSSLVFSQTNKAREIKQINSYVKGLNAFIEKNQKRHETFADISQTEKPKWRRFKSEKALDKIMINEAAYVWRRRGRLVAADFTLSSESGDWAHYVNYRYRHDGTLAKIEADLRTFYGNISVVRNLYFDIKGRLLRKTTQFRDLQSNQPVKPNENFIDEKFEIFKTTAKLPFAFLLRKTR
jgi:hypothetical protein